MSLSIVQNGGVVTGTASSDTITLTSVAAGNLLVVRVDIIESHFADIAVSDDKGNTWLAATAVITGSTNDSQAAIWYCLNAAAGTTIITVEFDAGSTSLIYDFTADEVESSTGGTWTLDASSTIAETTTTSHVCSASSTVIDTTAAAIVFTNSTVDTNGSQTFGTLTVGSGYTRTTASNAQTMWQYQVFTTSVADERGAFTSSTSRPTAACIAAFICTGSDCVPCWWPCCTPCDAIYGYRLLGDVLSGSGSSPGLAVDQYTASGDSWANKTDGPSPARYQFGSFAQGTAAYCCGGIGISGGGNLSDNDQYVLDTWTSKTNVNSPARRVCMGFPGGSDGYLTGGIAAAGILDTDCYSIAGDSWSAKTDHPTPQREEARVFGFGAKANLVYGITQVGSVKRKDNDEYDVAGDTWTAKTDGPTPNRFSLAGFVLDGLGYACNGATGGFGSKLTQVDELDPTGDSWTTRASTPSPARDFHSGMTIDTAGYVHGGETDIVGGLSDLDSYVVDVWSSKTDSPRAAAGHENQTI